MSKSVRRLLLERVRSGDVDHAERLTRSRTLVELRHEGQRLCFVYSTARKQIVTFVPGV